MTRRGLVILLLAFQLPIHAQTEEQYSAVVFYTTEVTGPRPIPVLYSNGQKIGEVRQDQSIRLIVRPGTYTFKLTEDAQLPVSLGTGQELFLRVTRTAFFLGNATEASASPWIVATSSTSTVANVSSPQSSSVAISIPQPLQHQEPAQRRGFEKGTPGILRCAFGGTLSIHSALQPASPVVAKIRCGDPVLLIDHSYMYPHLRTPDGKTGYILSLNLGQWTIDTQAQSTRSATQSANTRPERVAETTTPSAPAVAPPASASEDYVIGPEDLVEITVWREPGLTTKTVVRADGKIGIPVLSDVQASGLTTRQLREHLQQQFAEYVHGEQVSVTVMVRKR